jgi:hypothetical protein
MESAEKFNKIMDLSRARKEATCQDGNVSWDLYSYDSPKFSWAIVVYNIGGEVDIGTEMKSFNSRWRTDSNRPTLFYEYRETDNILKVPQQITVAGQDDIFCCSESIVKCAKKKTNESPSEYLKVTENYSPFQVNTDQKCLKNRSLQVQFLKALNFEKKEMPAVVFTDLTKGVALLVALLNELPANCSSVGAIFKLSASVEEVKSRASILESLVGKILNWIIGSCIIECQTSLSKYLNIFIPFMNAKQKNQDYTICGFKLTEMYLEDLSELQRKSTILPHETTLNVKKKTESILEYIPMDNEKKSKLIKQMKSGTKQVTVENCHTWLEAAEIAVRDHLGKECPDEEKIKGFHYKTQIYSTIKKHKLYITTGKTPWSTLNTALFKDIKDNPNISKFIKIVTPGRFVLREHYENISRTKEFEKGEDIEEDNIMERSSKRSKTKNQKTETETEQGNFFTY